MATPSVQNPFDHANIVAHSAAANLATLREDIEARHPGAWAVIDSSKETYYVGSTAKDAYDAAVEAGCRGGALIRVGDPRSYPAAL